MDAVAAVPGLYISDAFTASTHQILVEHHITHILTIAQASEIPERSRTDDELLKLVTKDVAIEDNPAEDILAELGNVYAWIDDALDGGRGRVLMHCVLGQSRSGAFLVGYIMKKLDLGFSAALQLARESREQIRPNVGFQQQLRIWQICEYEVFTTDKSTGERSGNAAYAAWTNEVNGLKRADWKTIRAGVLAGMAAAVAARSRDKSEEGRG